MRRVFTTLGIFAASLALPAQGVEWSLDAAEHLLNRAGFGGTPEDVARLHALGLEGAVDHLLQAGSTAAARSQPAFIPDYLGRPPARNLAGKTREERQAAAALARRRDREQMESVRGWWLARMIATPAPLEEKLTLFWHGHFTSSHRDVRNSYHMLRQNELFRLHAMGNFRLLLHEVSKDPAMLAYLDNNQNRKGRPNENFAREVMELFTLGTGNYTETDVIEAARAFTGWTFAGNRFVSAPARHDGGEKTILGHTGRFSGAEVLDILLEQPAAPVHVASRILRFFLGTDPSPGMAQRYGALLAASSWEIEPLLKTLFTDPAFYDPAVAGGRILSPVEYIVSLCRRLGEIPPPALLVSAVRQLGQDLFDPPDVKGWDGGISWITTSSFLARGNMAGYIIDGVDSRKLQRDFAPAMEEMGDGMDASDLRAMQRDTGRMVSRTFAGMGRAGYKPSRPLAPLVESASTPEDVVDILCERFLGVPVTEEARSSLVQLLAEQIETDSKGTYEKPSEARLRRLLRIILALPEAQLG